MADMFKKIKKQNGERFAKAIRAYDNGIFDIENLDKIVKYAGREAEPIMDYLISLCLKKWVAGSPYLWRNDYCRTSSASL